MGAVRASKTKITAENAFNQDHLLMEGSMNQITKKVFKGIFADSWMVP